MYSKMTEVITEQDVEFVPRKIESHFSVVVFNRLVLNANNSDELVPLNCKIMPADRQMRNRKAFVMKNYFKKSIHLRDWSSTSVHGPICCKVLI